MTQVSFVLGGTRSGKTRHALSLADRYQRKAYLATGEAGDEEMRVRIEQHKQERGPEWTTIEEPFEVCKAIDENAQHYDVILLDCITLWVSNIQLEFGEKKVWKVMESFYPMLESPPCSLVIVSNEVGQGIVPAYESARTFRDLVGKVNQEIAARAQTVSVLNAGIPITIKGEK